MKNLSLKTRSKRRKSKRPPLVSVVMPVYNAEKYLSIAINSVLKQTFKDFEFIIVDDASTDGSLKIIEQFARRSRRIKVLRNERRMGVSITVKRAIDEAKGNFIARMDADDVCFPKRFEKQLAYLKSNPKTVAVGTQCLLIDSRGRTIGEKTFPTEHQKIHEYIYHFVPLQQPSLMIAKKRLPRDFEFYHDGKNCAEEVELIFKLFMYGKVENLPDTLLKYRIHNGNTSLGNVKETFLLTLHSRIKALFAYGYVPSISGVMVTLAQTFIVLLLPQNVVLNIYKSIRNMDKVKFPSLQVFERARAFAR